MLLLTTQSALQSLQWFLKMGILRSLFLIILANCPHALLFKAWIKGLFAVLTT